MNCWLITLPWESVTRSVNVKVPALFGLPDSVAVVPLKTNVVPLGTLPTVRDHE